MSELGDEINKGIKYLRNGIDVSKLHRRYIYAIGVLIVLIICIFFIQRCQYKKESDKLVSDIVNYKTEAKHYTDMFGEIIATNSAIQVQTQTQIKSILATNDTMKAWIKKFKEIKFGGIIKETTIIKEVAVPFDKIIPCDFKPFPAIKLDKHYRFYSTIANTGLTIDSLFIPNTASIIVGEKKVGFLKLGRQLSIEVKNSNPFVHVSDLSAFTYKPKPKRFGLGFSVGYGIGVHQNTVYTSPFIGASLNYNLITF